MNPFQNAYRPSLPSSSSTKRYVQMPTGLPLPRGPLYQNDSFGGNDHHHQLSWDDHPTIQGGGASGAQIPGAEKPTGLRHFSTKVCEKVKEKGLTNYNEVADELVADYFQSNILKHIDVVKQEYDMKNIRRRVYDALNVLLAMNIITKNKKDIRWIGLPASASQEIARLEEEKIRREASIRAKKDSLQDMIMQIVSYKNLVERNRRNEHKNGRPDPETLLHLPFLIINTDKDTNVECSVSSDKSEFLFSFDKKFQIHDDFEVLKKMKLACGLDTGNPTSEELITAKSFLPNLHQAYVDDIVTTHQQREIEREEKQKAEILRLEAEERQQLAQLQYFEAQQAEERERAHQQQHVPNVSRYNRQLQEHLINDEDRSAAAGIMERDDEMMMMSMDNKSNVRQMYGGGSSGSSGYSPQKTQSLNRQNQGGGPVARRYYVQKAPGAQGGGGPMRSELSPAVHRQSAAARPYTVHQQGGARMAAGGGTVGAPVKYYSPSSGGAGPGPSSSAMPRYRVRPAGQGMGAGGGAPPPQQHIRYSTGGTAQLAPGQRIVTQRIVAPGGPHPPGTIVRKVIRRVVPSGAPKQSPAQQVIQKKMMEQDMHHEQQQQIKMDAPMTSKQAAAMIQHPPPTEFDDYY